MIANSFSRVKTLNPDGPSDNQGTPLKSVDEPVQIKEAPLEPEPLQEVTNQTVQVIEDFVEASETIEEPVQEEIEQTEATPYKTEEPEAVEIRSHEVIPEVEAQVSEEQPVEQVSQVEITEVKPSVEDILEPELAEEPLQTEPEVINIETPETVSEVSEQKPVDEAPQIGTNEVEQPHEDMPVDVETAEPVKTEPEETKPADVITESELTEAETAQETVPEETKQGQEVHDNSEEFMMDDEDDIDIDVNKLVVEADSGAQ